MRSKQLKFYKGIGKNIKEWRKLKKIGQEDLADKISISRSSLSNIEIGNHQPTIHVIYEIALALDCDITDILPSLNLYKSSQTQIDKKYEDIINSLPTSNNKKTLNVLKEILKENGN